MFALGAAGYEYVCAKSNGAVKLHQYSLTLALIKMRYDYYTTYNATAEAGKRKPFKCHPSWFSEKTVTTKTNSGQTITIEIGAY